MNGLCGMISIDEFSGDDFGDSSYGMPIGAHYYMDNVRSEFGEDGSDSPDFGTEGFPEEFLGGPITFGEDFGAEVGQASWSDGSSSPHAAAMAAAIDVSTVRQVQSRLNALGYGPLVTDGLLGPKTLRALGKFQVAAGLPTSGLDAAALNALIGYVPGM
jgi:hypothetical protein